MSDLFNFEPKTDDYAVMGNPISHSKSPAIHSAFAQQTQQHINYTTIHVDLGGFPQAVGNFFATGGKGLNVTVPFKQEAWKISEQRSERAQIAGAVNTLLMKDNQLFGDNTDGAGLVRDLSNNLNLKLTKMRILILGAGGASRGVLLPILNENPELLVIANRSVDKAYELATLFSAYGNIKGSNFADLSKQTGNHAGEQAFDLVINATSASLHGQLPQIPATVFANDACCYDMMYGAKPTAFMQWASENGAVQTSDGLGMLVEQAAESFYLWRGILPESKTVIQQIRASLT